MQKTVVARKDHQCAYCDRTIAKGEKYELMKGRLSKLDDNDKQIGIVFYTCRLCEHSKCTKVPEFEEYYHAYEGNLPF